MRNRILAALLMATGAMLVVFVATASAVVVQYYDSWTGENQVTLRIDAVGLGDLLVGNGLYTNGRNMAATGTYDISVGVVSATRPVYFRFCTETTDNAGYAMLNCVGTNSSTGPLGAGGTLSANLKYRSPTSVSQLVGYFGLLEISFQGTTHGLDVQAYIPLNNQTPGPLPVDLPVLGNIEDITDQLGGDEDNDYTAFDAGLFDEEGAGMCSAQGLPTYQVNMSQLLPVIKDADLIWKSFGHDMSLRRTWNLRPGQSGMFGNGWTFAYESSIRAYHLSDSGRAFLRLGSGQVIPYAAGIAYGTGTGSLVAQYTRAAPGVGPDMTGYIAETTGVGYFLLYDRKRKLTRRYDYARTMADTGERVYLLGSITDRNDNTVSLEYDADWRLTRLTDASGRSVSFTYDGQGHCTTIATFTGASISFQYDAAGNLQRSQDMAANVTTYAYDVANRLTSMTAVGKTTQFAYGSLDGRPYLESLTNANGVTRQYAPVGRDTRLTEPGGDVRSYKSAFGKTGTLTDEAGGVTTVSYNALQLPARVTDPRGYTRGYAYDMDGNPTKVTDADGKSFTLGYDAAGNLASHVDALGNRWSYEYDAKNNLVAKVSPLGLRTAYTVDAKGLVTAVTKPGGAVTSYTYDVHGNLTRQNNPDGGYWTKTYDASGLDAITRRDPRGFITTFAHDANRRLLGVGRPDGSSLGYGYDCCALSRFTDGAGNTTQYARDALLNITAVTDPLGNVTSQSFDNDGYLVATTDPLGNSSTFSYDAAHRLAGVVNPVGSAIAIARDASGNPISLTDARGKVTTREYDSQGRLTDVTDPLGAPTLYITRDDAGQVAFTRNARIMFVDYAYDADGRVVEKRYDGSVAATYAYGVDGRLSAYADASGTTSLTRDAGGRVTGIGYPGGSSLAMTYDLAGNVAAMTYPGGLTVQYAYDGLNRPTQVSFAGNTLVLAYDAAGRLVRETRSNGLESVYGYDAAGRLVGVRHGSGANGIADIAYARDARGNVTAETGTWPLLPQLAVASASGAYNDANGVTTFDNTGFTSDVDGNVTAMSGARSFAATYDAENRLVSMTVSGTNTQYAYDALGNRFRAVAGSNTRLFRHDPFGRLVCQANGSGAVVAHYIYAGGRLVASGDAAAGYAWHHQDKIGNTLALTDAAGTVTATYAYTPHGAVAGHGGAAATPFTFVGAYGVMDEGNGIYFMQNRYYDAITGRFLQRDPLGPVDGFNLYRYVRNNPVSRIDPSGLIEDEALGALADNPQARIPPPDSRVSKFIDQAQTAADITLSSAPDAISGPYTAVKALYAAYGEEGADSKTDRALAVAWEIGKAVYTIPGTVADFFFAGNERNRDLARESQEQMAKEEKEQRTKWNGAYGKYDYCFPRMD